MSRRNHEKMSELFLWACNLEPEMQEKFLDRVCAGRPDLRAELQELLTYDRYTGDEPLDEGA